MPTIHKDYSESRRKGNLGEDIACLFLMKRGFTIVERNYLKPWGEIDVVAEKRGTIHFIEVKSAFSDVSRENVTHETMRPEENITEGKTSRLERAIKTYLIERKLSRETVYQVDAITVRLDRVSKTATVESFEKIL